jgi:hypothetical protein
VADQELGHDLGVEGGAAGAARDAVRVRSTDPDTLALAAWRLRQRDT